MRLLFLTIFSRKERDMICRYCGSEFEPKKRGRKNTGFCCKRCANNWRAENVPKRYSKTCEFCGAVFQTNRKIQKFCCKECSHKAKKTGRTVYDKTCLYCGTEFQTIDPKRKYCTSACAARHAGDLRKGTYFCEYCGKPRWSDHPNRNRFCSRECANKAKRIETLARQEQKRKRRDWDKNRVCDCCGKAFIARNSRQRFCSKACRYEDAIRAQHKKKEAAFTPLIRICPRCGKSFATTLQAQDKQYCSEECRARDAAERYKAKRKEQMQQSFVEPVGIKTTYHAFQGRCAICGLPVPPTTECDNQWAATVDHVLPLSKGGLHEKKNCQLAHRLCNSLKLDTEAEFKIDWKSKLKSEPGRWNQQLDDLWDQLDVENQSAG